MEMFQQLSTSIAIVLFYLIGLVGMVGILVMVSVWAFDRILTARKIREEFLDFVQVKHKKKTVNPKIRMDSENNKNGGERS